MHSSIFDAEGPTTRSVYAPARQHDLYNNLHPKIRKNNQSPPAMDLPRAADIAATHQAGHGAAMPSDHAHHQPFLNSPRTTGRDCLAAEGDPLRVTRAQPHKGTEGHIPKEFWETSVNVEWHDTRNEITRSRGGAECRSSKDMKMHEISSEVFGNPRMMEASTRAPRKEILAETAHVLEKDSCFDKHHQPRSDGGGYPGNEAPVASARFHNNLRGSVLNTMNSSRKAEVLEPATVDEAPSTLGRRRQERNFSDIFGEDAAAAGRSQVRGQRE